MILNEGGQFDEIIRGPIISIRLFDNLRWRDLKEKSVTKYSGEKDQMGNAALISDILWLLIGRLAVQSGLCHTPNQTTSVLRWMSHLQGALLHKELF